MQAILLATYHLFVRSTPLDGRRALRRRTRPAEADVARTAEHVG